MWTRRKFLGKSSICVSTTWATISGSRPLLSSSAHLQEEPSLNPHREIADANGESAVNAAKAVLVRQLGSRAADFHLRLIPSEQGREVYEVEARNGVVSVAGSSAVAMCRGAYIYLRTACNCMITWSGFHLDLPAVLPDLDRRRTACPYKFVQYLNPCTFSYTTAFWDWARWEREIDWMALHGINMPLALEGQEAIWQKVWRSIGLTQREIDHSSTGPAYLPWHRMGNIDNFSGPLPSCWIEAKSALQLRILNRMRALGMKPVVPGFAGFVPQGFKRLHPDAKTFTLLWLAKEFKTIPRSSSTFILHPGQSHLYRLIGKKFIEEYKAQYGHVQYYLADTFNELSVPVRPDHRYEDLECFGRTVYEGIQAGDPQGTWVMQSWLFVYDSAFWDKQSVAALLRGVPSNRMLIIDYANDLTRDLRDKYAPEQWKTQDAFYGKQWIAGMAHTFGGNNNMKGNLALMATRPAEILHSPDRGNLVGWGICPEGIENNEVVYELLTDAGWESEPIDLERWIPNYCSARYGACPAEMKKAWELLIGSAYSSHVWMSKQAWQAEPGSAVAASSVNSGLTFEAAVELFLSCAKYFPGNQLYRNDLIELVAQAVGGHVDRLLRSAVSTEGKTAAGRAAQNGAVALAWLNRLDGLINVRPDRRLETWTKAARSWAKSSDLAAYFEEDGRRLITTWGWPELNDYASRVWSGLIRDYYVPRWSAFLESQRSQNPFSMDIWQQAWLSSPYLPSQPLHVVDPIAEARFLFEECRHESAINS